MPLVVDERNIKERLLGEILKIFNPRSVKKESTGGYIPRPRATISPTSSPWQ